MNRLERVLRLAVGDLNRTEHGWALVGGLAVGARVEPRLTRDVDVALAVRDDREAESVVFALKASGWIPRTTLEHTPTGRLGTVRLVHTGEPEPAVFLDILFASCGIEPEVVAEATALDVLPDVSVPVASIGHLLAMKTLAEDARRRPQDWDDVMHLLDAADDREILRAQAALECIADRGFARGKDLAGEFERLRAEHAALRRREDQGT